MVSKPEDVEAIAAVEPRAKLAPINEIPTTEFLKQCVLNIEFNMIGVPISIKLTGCVRVVVRVECVHKMNIHSLCL